MPKEGAAGVASAARQWLAVSVLSRVIPSTWVQRMAQNSRVSRRRALDGCSPKQPLYHHIGLSGDDFEQKPEKGFRKTGRRNFHVAKVRHARGFRGVRL